eukprot:157940-Amphidinium_carterae.2
MTGQLSASPKAPPDVASSTPLPRATEVAPGTLPPIATEATPTSVPQVAATEVAPTGQQAPVDVDIMIWQSLQCLGTAIIRTQSLVQSTVANHLDLHGRVVTLETSGQSSAMNDSNMSPPPVPQQQPQYYIPRLFQGLRKRMEYMQRRYEARVSSLEDTIQHMTQAWKGQRNHNKQTEEAVSNLTSTLKERKEWVFEKLAELELSKEKDVETVSEIKAKVEDLEQTMVELVAVFSKTQTSVEDPAVD